MWLSCKLVRHRFTSTVQRSKQVRLCWILWLFWVWGVGRGQVERQRAAVELVEADAAEEGRINRELSALMLARLDASRKAAEKLLGVLQVHPAML